MNKPINGGQAVRKNPKLLLWQRYTPTLLFHHLWWLKNMLFVGLLFSFVGSILFFLFDPHTLPVTTVQIEGHLQQTDPKILQMLVSQVAIGNFLNINPTVIRRTVVTLPWIKDAQIFRQWPNTLRIRIQEYQAVAWWNKQAFVDELGHLFTKPFLSEKRRHNHLPTIRNEKTKNLKLPWFMGPPKRVGEVLKRYRQLAPLLQKKGLHIHELGCNARLAWYLVLDNGMKLKLGRNESKTKVQRFLNIYNRLAMQLRKPSGKNSVLHVDLRYTNGLAVQIKQVK